MKQCSWSRSVLLLVLVLVLNTVMMPSVVPPTPVFAATKDVVHCTDTDVAL